MKRGVTLSQLVAKNNNYSYAIARIICAGLTASTAAIEESSPRRHGGHEERDYQVT
jgi:hypothetical protein